MDNWTDVMNQREKDAVRQRMVLKDKIRQALKCGNYVEAGQIQMQLRSWEKEFAQDNGCLPNYEEY
jgi:hypothetical protein